MRLRTIISCVLLFLSGISFGQSSNYEKVVDSLRNIGQQAKIIPYLEQELKAKPNQELLLRMLGFYHIEGKNLDVAEQYYREALAVNPKCAKCYMNIGRIYAMRNDFIRALEHFDLGIVNDPKDGFIVLWRARLKDYQGDKTAALADYDQAVILEANNGAVYLQRALFHANQGQLTLAMNDLNKTISLSPTDLLPYLHRATLHFKMEDLDAACQDYQTAQKLNAQQKTIDTLLTSQIESAVQDICNTEKPSYFYQRGIAFYNLKQYQKAIDVYDQGLQKFPAHAMILNFKGNAYLALQKYDKALLCYQLALKNKESLLTEIKSNPHFSFTGQQQSSKTENNMVNIEEIFNAFLAEIHLHVAEYQLLISNIEDASTAIDKAITLAPEAQGFPRKRYLDLREKISKKNGVQKSHSN